MGGCGGRAVSSLGGGLGAACGKCCWGAEADALREEDAGIVVGEGGWGREFVRMPVGVEDVEGEVRPGDLSFRVLD